MLELRAPRESNEKDIWWKEGCVKAFKTILYELSTP